MPEIRRFNPKVPIDTGSSGRLIATPQDEQALQGLGNNIQKLGSAINEFANKQRIATEANQAHELLIAAEETIESRLDELRRRGPGSINLRKDGAKIINEEYTKLLGQASRFGSTAQSFLREKSTEGRFRSVVRVGNEADKIFIEENKSALEIMLPKLKERVIRAQSPQEKESALKDLNGYIDSQIGIGLRVDEAERKRAALQKDIRVARIKSEGLVDPIGAMVSLGQEKGLTVEETTNLQQFLESRLRTLNSAQERLERKEEKEVNDRLDSMVDNFFQQIQQGQDVREEIAELTTVLGSKRAKRILDFQDEQEDNRAKGVKSNPDVLLQVSTWVNGGINPDSGEERLPTFEELRQLGVEEKLSATHVGYFQRQISEKIKARNSKGDTLRNRLISAGQKRVHAALRSSGFLDKFDPSAEQARALALKEYQDIVLRDRKADPLIVADEITARYMRAIFQQGSVQAQRLLRAAPITETGEIIDTKEKLLDAIERGDINKRVGEIWFDMFSFIEEQRVSTGSQPQAEKKDFDITEFIKKFFEAKPRVARPRK